MLLIEFPQMKTLILRAAFLGLSTFIFSCIPKHEEGFIASDVFFGFKQSNHVRDSITSALYPELEKAMHYDNTLQNRVSLNHLLTNLRSTRDTIAFRKIAKLAKDYANESNDIIQLADVYYNIGIYSEINNIDDEAYRSYIKASKLYQKTGNQFKYGELEFYQARVLYKKGVPILAEAHINEVLNIFEDKYKCTYIYFEACRSLGRYLILRGEYNEGMNYYNESLKFLEQNKSTLLKSDPKYYKLAFSVIHASLSEAYSISGEYKKAIDLAKLALSYHEGDEYPALRYSIQLHQFLSAFKIAPSTDHINPLMALYVSAHQNGFYNHSFEIAIAIGNSFAALKQEQQANYWFRTALSFGKLYGSKIMQKRALDSLLTLQDDINIQDFNQSLALSSDIEKEKQDVFLEFSRIINNTKVILIENRNVKEERIVFSIIVCVITFIFFIFIRSLYLRNRTAQLKSIEAQKESNELINQLIIERGILSIESKKKERNKIARNLHDSVVNGIFTVRFNLELTELANNTLKKGLVRELRFLEKSVRNISHDLMNNELFKENDFLELTEDFVLFQANQWNTQFNFTFDDKFDYDRLNAHYRINIFYIIREVIQNVNKHSKASICNVRFSTISDKKLRLSIEDNGIGINVNNKKGIGLVSIHERANTIKSKLLIEGLYPCGTSVILDIKIP